MPNDAEGGCTNGPSNERTGLLNGDSGRHGSSQRWSRRDDRFWVSIPYEVCHLTYATLASNYINILLVFVPLGLLSGFLGWSPTSTFVLNFIAIMPLASLLSFATEELASTLGETLGGLLNATFGNAVELIVRLISLIIIYIMDGTALLTGCRSASSLCPRMKSALSSPACWGVCSPTSSSS